MGLRTNPTQRQRRLGQELRKLRDASGLSAGEAGAAVGLGGPHLGHIERARTAIPEGKLRTLAAKYGCQDKPYIEALVAMGNASGRGWWHEYRKVMDSRALDLAELEDSALAHRTFQWLYIPGLLQTEEYTRALFQAPTAESDLKAFERQVEFRLRRQRVLTSSNPPMLHAVIHEAALHMGFVEAAIMRRQLEHLLVAAELPNVRIQFLPFKAKANPEVRGVPFSIFRGFGPPAEHGLRGASGVVPLPGGHSAPGRVRADLREPQLRRAAST